MCIHFFWGEGQCLEDFKLLKITQNYKIYHIKEIDSTALLLLIVTYYSEGEEDCVLVVPPGNRRFLWQKIDLN